MSKLSPVGETGWGTGEAALLWMSPARLHNAACTISPWLVGRLRTCDYVGRRSTLRVRSPPPDHVPLGRSVCRPASTSPLRWRHLSAPRWRHHSRPAPTPTVPASRSVWFDRRSRSVVRRHHHAYPGPSCLVWCRVAAVAAAVVDVVVAGAAAAAAAAAPSIAVPRPVIPTRCARQRSIPPPASPRRRLTPLSFAQTARHRSPAPHRPAAERTPQCFYAWTRPARHGSAPVGTDRKRTLPAWGARTASAAAAPRRRARRAKRAPPRPPANSRCAWHRKWRQRRASREHAGSRRPAAAARPLAPTSAPTCCASASRGRRRREARETRTTVWGILETPTTTVRTARMEQEQSNDGVRTEQEQSKNRARTEQ